MRGYLCLGVSTVSVSASASASAGSIQPVGLLARKLTSMPWRGGLHRRRPERVRHCHFAARPSSAALHFPVRVS